MTAGPSPLKEGNLRMRFTMTAVAKPLQVAPFVVKEMKKKHPLLYFIGAIGLLIFLSYGVIHFFLIKKTEDLQVKNDALALEVTNLKLFQEQSARILRLEQILLSNEYIKKQLGQDNIPNFAFKILSTADMYKEDGLTASLLLAIIEIESNFQPRAVSESGAHGLMQVMRSTATPYLRAKNREWSEEIMFDPFVNMTIGTEVLIDMHRMFIARGMEKKDEWTLTLICYNQGESAIKSATKKHNPVYLDYAVKVRMAARKWDSLGL